MFCINIDTFIVSHRATEVHMRKKIVIARTAKQDEATQAHPCDALLGCFVATLLAMTG